MQKDKTRYGKLQEVKQFEFQQIRATSIYIRYGGYKKYEYKATESIEGGQHFCTQKVWKLQQQSVFCQTQLSVGSTPTRRANFFYRDNQHLSLLYAGSSTGRAVVIGKQCHE